MKQSVPEHTHTRMIRNSRALILSSTVTSAFGLVFWLVAARWFGARELGIGLAFVTAMTLIAGMSTLGLRNGLVRFLPETGDQSRRLIVRSYALCATVGAALALVFAAGQRLWAPALVSLRTDPAHLTLFVVATAGWTVFVLQDSVLTGLHHATWIPAENALYAIAKLGLVMALPFAGEWGIMLAWSVPALVLLVPVNLLIVRRLLPALDTHSAGTIRTGSLVRFAAGDHTADLIRIAGSEVVVLVVLAKVGPELAASYFIAATIPASIGLITANVASAFVAEAAAQPANARALLRRGARQAVVLVVPVVVAATIAAPWILSVFGGNYRTEATSVFRLMLLSTIPQIVASLAVGFARSQRRVGLVVLIFAVNAIAPLVGAFVGLARWGLVAVGVATLVGQCIVVAAVATVLVRHGEAAPLLNRVARAASRVRGEARHRRRVHAVAGVLDEIELTRELGGRLGARRVLRTDNDTAVAMIDDGTEGRVIRVALSDAAANGIARHVDALTAMHEVGAKRGIDTERLPSVLQTGTCLGHHFAVETAKAGIRPDVATIATVSRAVAAFQWCHQFERQVRPLDSVRLEKLIDDPIRILTADHRLVVDDLATFHDLQVHLHSNLRGLEVITSRTQGDAWLGNLLVDPLDSSVIGILDWEDSVPDGLPDVDLVHLWTSVRSGYAIAEAYNVVTIQELVGSQFCRMPNPTLPAGPLVMLAWLLHTSSGLRRATEYGLSTRWFDQNIQQALTHWKRAIATARYVMHPIPADRLRQLAQRV